MKVTILGTGYVGLITGVCLANKGHQVVCVDNNKDKVKKLNSSIPTIYEKSLDKLLKKVIKNKNFSATENLNKALEDSKIVIVAVGTPTSKNKISLNFLEKACKDIGKFIKVSDKFLSVIIKSTVIPGTTDTFVKNILEKESGKLLGQFGLGMNPEFLREGNAVQDFDNPDRIIFGYEDNKTLFLLKQLYYPWNVSKISMNSRSAEFVKYSNNVLLASQISIINELANFSHDLGNVEFEKILKGVHSDRRWSPILKNGKKISPDILTYLIPGCGFGGSCFSKDLKALRNQAESISSKTQVIDAVLKVNDLQPLRVINILKKMTDLKNKKILVLGLAFKQDTDDIRESPSIKMISKLLKEGARVTAHDPVAIKNFKKNSKIKNENLSYKQKWIDLLNKHEIVILATAWKEYKKINKLNMNGKIIFDCRNLIQGRQIHKSNRIISLSNS